MKLTGTRSWISVDKNYATKNEFEEELLKTARNYDSSRWFNENNELIQFGGTTYSFSNQHGKRTFDLVKNISKIILN